MPPFTQWADLPPELLSHIGDGLDLRAYAGARETCTAWRRALVPPSPSLLVVPHDAQCCPCAVSLTTRRSFELKALPLVVFPSGGRRRIVGSSNGWLALSIDDSRSFSLFNPVTATEILLPPLIGEGGPWIYKLVFSPNPASDDFIVTAICGFDRLAYVTAGARRWAVLDPVPLTHGDKLADLVYHEEGRVYCVTCYGDVHILHLPERRRRKSILAKDPTSEPTKPLLLPREPTKRLVLSRAERFHGWHTQQQQHHSIRLIRPPPRLVKPKPEPEPDLNAPATVEPLVVSRGNLPFDPATSFAPPYNKLTVFTSAKHLAFCEGNLYQIWRNMCCTMNLLLPGGARHRLEEYQVFVLRYQPQCRPCWDVVTDLGGYSFFLGRNNAVSVYSQGVPGLKGNCVYWIGESGRDRGMVFDMATGRSTPCIPPAPRDAPRRTICWYFLNDMEKNCSNNRGESVYQIGSTVHADREKQEYMEE